MTNLIAAYAAFVATVALVWQAVTYALAKRSKLLVRFEPVLIVEAGSERGLYGAFEGRASSMTLTMAELDGRSRTTQY